jgi:hypothetical protein
MTTYFESPAIDTCGCANEKARFPFVDALNPSYITFTALRMPKKKNEKDLGKMGDRYGRPYLY